MPGEALLGGTTGASTRSYRMTFFVKLILPVVEVIGVSKKYGWTTIEKEMNNHSNESLLMLVIVISEHIRMIAASFRRGSIPAGLTHNYSMVYPERCLVRALE